MRVTPIFTVMICLILSVGAVVARAGAKDEKISLKVLYVGYRPEKPMPANVVYYSTAQKVVEQVYKTRMADFKSFLESRFGEVEVVDVRDYTPEMSDNADVTILDAGPVKLPPDFSRPVMLMHAMAPNVGLPIGLKFDWYCQCLEDDALNINLKHEIFNSPVKVKPTMETRPTPESFFNGFQGLKTPKEMPMWKVVKGDASIEGKYLIGMVSHGEGFNDSPDAEAISGGVCLKNAEAVALGRQGNYFMWGFAASPDHMTDEARDVFVNAGVKEDDSQAAEPSLSDPVAVSARLVYAADKESADLILSANMLKGWHVYAFVPSDSPFIPTEPRLELPEGAVVSKDWQMPAASPFPGSKGVFVFEGKVFYKIKIDCRSVKPGSVIKCGLFYQTCNDNKCLQPTTKMVEVPIG